MIQANELRIGNWVKDSFGYLVIGVNAKVEFASAYEPITLTPEILEKCGFDDFKSNVYGNDEYIELDLDGDIYNVFIKQINIDETIDSILMHNQIKYLHQLQNLYFALTGEELTFKH